VRQITAFAGNRLFVMASTVNGYRPYILRRGVVPLGRERRMSKKQDRSRDSLSQRQVILMIVAVIVLLIFAWTYIG